MIQVNLRAARYQLGQTRRKQRFTQGVQASGAVSKNSVREQVVSQPCTRTYAGATKGAPLRL